MANLVTGFTAADCSGTLGQVQQKIEEWLIFTFDEKEINQLCVNSVQN